jgi:hypothetical protein
MFFWIRGAGGFLLNGFAFLGLTGNVGVGTSAYMSACILLWIGGMVLFGLGAIIIPGSMNFQRPAAPPAA